jgi:hypothetical protein
MLVGTTFSDRTARSTLPPVVAHGTEDSASHTMMEVERLPGWTPIVALAVAAIACGSTGIDVNQVDNSSQSSEGGANTGTNPPPTGFSDPFAGAPGYSPPGQGGGDNSHHAGESCMQQGCHSDAGGHSEAPAFLIGGTVYQDYYGTVPAQGIEVRVLDSSGNAVSAYSDRGGNFYVRASNANGVTLPAQVGARNGTVSRPMITTLSSTMGSCAQSPCHVAGGKPSTGTYYPIHVP